MAEHVRDNAEAWGVAELVLPLHLGVPDTPFVAGTFDAVYSTTTLEMVRWEKGDEGYARCMEEIRRVLRPGGVFGLAEPMHTGIPIPDDLLPHVSQEPFGWKDCFRSLEDTIRPIQSAGLEVVESGLAPRARDWWMEFAAHDPFCKAEPEGDPRRLEVDGGRWATVGYVVSRSPS
jgi:SAM-dependent methyltransferase